jgi:hypothetical protein
MLRIIALLCLSASSALACWDGHLVQTDRISFRGDNDSWSASEVRRYARWLPRLQAVLPPGSFIRDVGTVELCGPATSGDDEPNCTDLGWAPALPELFKAVGAHFNVPARKIRAARALVGHAYTVQVASLGSKAGVQRMLNDLYDLNTETADAAIIGFVEYGGFPANNAVAYALEGADRHRVVVGTFLDRASAQRAARMLAKKHGLKGFVRRL